MSVQKSGLTDIMAERYDVGVWHMRTRPEVEVFAYPGLRVLLLDFLRTAARVTPS